jgi:hypothetical protein
MNEKIMLWQGLIIGGVGALTTVVIVVIQAYAKIRAEIAKFKSIQKSDGTEVALKQTRLTHADVKKRKI